MSLTARGKLAGIVGWPVAHSLSPQLHQHWLSENNIDGAYIPLAVAREDLAKVLSTLSRAGFTGVNVTVPHKEAAFALAHSLDEAALGAGAVNILLFRGDRLEGRNTDVPGLAASLTEALGGEALRGLTVCVLGAGGAARSAILACDRLGATDIHIVSRKVDRAETLAATLRSHVRAALSAASWNDRSGMMAGSGLLINATSGGMKGAAPLELDVGALPADATVCDLVYAPLATDLLKAARARRLRAIDGLGMLMYQAAPAFEAFYGVTPSVSSALRATLEQALRDAG